MTKSLWDIYVEKMKVEHPGKPYATHHQFRDIYNTLNYGVHQPKKDQCDTCVSFDNLLQTEKAKQQAAHDLNLQRKVEAREQKEADKQDAINCQGVAFACYDLQKVMHIPKCNVGRMCYLRKVTACNFTVWALVG